MRGCERDKGAVETERQERVSQRGRERERERGREGEQEK